MLNGLKQTNSSILREKKDLNFLTKNLSYHFLFKNNTVEYVFPNRKLNTTTNGDLQRLI